MTLPSETLVEELTCELQRDPKGPGVAALLSRFARVQDDWRRYVHFDEGKYTRNLVARTDLFELLVLCWNPDQKSPIHDHQSQRCWMAVLDGDIEEAQYAVPQDGQPGPMATLATRTHARGEVAFITDEVGLHDVGAVGGRPSISLHLYVGPISACRAFDPRTGLSSMRQLSYDSVEGCLAPSPEALPKQK